MSGFIKFPEPTSSFAPHFDGHRCASLGISHDCARSAATENPNASAKITTRTGHIARMFFLLRIDPKFARVSHRLAGRGQVFSGAGFSLWGLVLARTTPTG